VIACPHHFGAYAKRGISHSAEAVIKSPFFHVVIACPIISGLTPKEGTRGILYARVITLPNPQKKGQAKITKVLFNRTVLT